MQILFDYYDSVENDNVIEEIYDSPVCGYFMTCSEFSNSPSSRGEKFHSYLINYCNTYLNIDIENKGGLSNLDQFKLINSYIGTSRYLEYSCNTSEGNIADILSGRQFGIIKDAINNGRPVILNTLKHSMVAFGYDDDYVYVMSGWYSNVISKMSWDNVHGNIFTNYCAAYDLVIDSHSCTDNYYSNIVGKYLCPKDGIHE